MTSPSPRDRLDIELSVDASGLADALDVMHRAFAEYAQTGTPSGAMAETVESLSEEVAAGTSVAVVRAGGEAVAVAKHRPAKDCTLYFGRLGVVPEARGTGVARVLVETLREHALSLGLDGLSCLVRADEEGNIALYEKCGMTVVARGERVSRLGATIAVVEMSDIGPSGAETAGVEMRDVARHP